MTVLVHLGKGSEPQFVGATLGHFERNGYHDSDFFAIVWDDVAGCVREIEYLTTRFGSWGSATVDATAEVLARAEAWLADATERALTAEFEADAVLPKIGRRVKSLTTRGKNAGIEGVVERDEPNRYRSAPRGGYNADMMHLPHMRRYAVRTDAGALAWMDGDRIAVITPAQADPVAIRQQAEAKARHHGWRGATSGHAQFAAR